MIYSLQRLQTRVSLSGVRIARSPVNDSAHAIARQILDIEAALPVEQLCANFLAQRRAWRKNLQDAQEYATVLTAVRVLEVSVQKPPESALLQRLLVGWKGIKGDGSCGAVRAIGLPLPLALEVAQFVGVNGSVPGIAGVTAFKTPADLNFQGSETIAQLWRLVAAVRYEELTTPKVKTLETPTQWRDMASCETWGHAR